MFLKRSQSQEISHRTSTTDHIAPQYKKIRITWTGTEIYKLSFISNLLRAKRLLHNLPFPSRLLLVPVDWPLQNHIPLAVAHITRWHLLCSTFPASFFFSSRGYFRFFSFAPETWFSNIWSSTSRASTWPDFPPRCSSVWPLIKSSKTLVSSLYF